MSGAGPHEELRALIDRLDDDQAQMVREWARMLSREIDFLERRSASPLADMLGVVSEGAQDGRARFRVASGPGLYNPNGVLHGGVIYVMVDSCMGAAVMSALPPEQRCTTIELKINYLHAVRDSELVCESEVTKLGRNIAFVDSRVRDDQERLVATASGTMFILRPKAGEQ